MSGRPVDVPARTNPILPADSIGHGNGQFSGPYNFPTDLVSGPRPVQVVIANMDQYLLNDLVVVNQKSQNVAVLINAFTAVPVDPP